MTKTQEISLDELWNSASIGNQVFDPELLIDRPDLARRYLENAFAQRPLWGIAPGTPLASAVRLWMHGEIKLGEKWHPFSITVVDDVNCFLVLQLYLIGGEGRSLFVVEEASCRLMGSAPN